MADPRRTIPASLDPVAPAHVLVVEARFYDEIVDDLATGAQRVLTAAGATFETVVVPGALEIPAAIAMALAVETPAFDAAVVLGCIMRGDTYHFDVVANESSRGLTDIAVRHAFPIGNAILTVEDDEQAVVRADPARGDKGGEAAHAALALLRLKRKFGSR